jgi:hypothetical protein
MSAAESYDGLCGIIAHFSTSDLQIRCDYFVGHQGPCSFEKYKRNFYVFCGVSLKDYDTWYNNKEDEDGIKRGFIDSVVYHEKK